MMNHILLISFQTLLEAMVVLCPMNIAISDRRGKIPFWHKPKERTLAMGKQTLETKFEIWKMKENIKLKMGLI